MQTRLSNTPQKSLRERGFRLKIFSGFLLERFMEGLAHVGVGVEEANGDRLLAGA
jgi:hypothetical protein